MDKHEAHRRLIERLRDQAEDVRRLTDGLDEGRLATRTIPDKWSLKELVCHLLRIQQLFAGRVQATLTQDKPVIDAYEPEGDPRFAELAARPAAQSIAEFAAGREQLATDLSKLTPHDWHRNATHPEFPNVNYDVHFQVEYLAHHEAHHIYQMF